jgi:hypothetical protein
MKFWSMRLLIISFTCLIISACAGKEIVNTKNIQQQSVVEANNSKMSPAQAIQAAETKYADAIKVELNLFSPIHLSQAQDSISQAHERLKTAPKATVDTALMSAIAAQSFIDDGYKNKKTVQANLTEVLAHNAALIKLNAPSLLESDYQEIQAQLLDLFKLIERGQTAEAILEQAPLMVEMSKLEIKTLQHTHLSEAERLISMAKDINGEKYAEVSFKKAANLIQTANTFITKNYRNSKGVKQVGEKALWAANHAYFVSLESQKIMQLESTESEQYILSIISQQNKLSQITASKDLTPQTLASADTELLKLIESLKTKLELSQQELNNALTSNTTSTSTFNKAILPSDDEVVLIRTLLPLTKRDEEPLFLERETKAREPRLQADEQGFDDVEQMINDQ